MTDTNKKYLISQIEGLTELNGRYQSLKCINFNSTEPRRGNFSLVFRAFDTVEERDVAIKFFDPDLLADSYRLACFQREPEILTMLSGSRRCLQLDGPMRQYDLRIPLPDGTEFLAPVLYFVANWVDRDIDSYFEVQDKMEALAKLDVFRGVVLAVASVHRKEISHRDVQVKNFRSDGNENRELVIAIDFGTAAAFDSGPIRSRYDSPVGMLRYAAPECFLGLAGDRNIGNLADIYSLGCLLFELFNMHLFSFVRDNCTGYQTAVTALALALVSEKDVAAKKVAWRKNIAVFRGLTAPPPIDGPGTSLPAAINPLITELYEKMVQFDYRHRQKNLDLVIRRIDSAVKVLTNEAIYQARLDAQRQTREEKLASVAAKLKRLENRNVALVQKC